MAVFVCLLRAIGPVTHEKMSMAALREACETAGFENVVTVGNTGNLICTSGKTAAVVRKEAQTVVDSFGIKSEVFIRTPRQMMMVVRADPFPAAAKDRPAEVGVCSFHKTPRWPAWVREFDGPQKLATSGAHLIVDYPGGQAGGFDIEKRIGAKMTQRNWQVFANLAERAKAHGKG